MNAAMPAPRAVVVHAALTGAAEGRGLVAAQRELARACVQAAARRSGWRTEPLAVDGRGAPRPAAGGWSWSLSHAKGVVAGAVSELPIGVDLEPRDRPVRALERWVGADELALLDALGARCGDRERLVRLWTAKEAVLKREGVGLAGLARCRLAAAAGDSMLLDYAGAPRAVAHFGLRGHVLALCTGEKIPCIEYAALDERPAELPA